MLLNQGPVDSRIPLIVWKSLQLDAPVAHLGEAPYCRVSRGCKPINDMSTVQSITTVSPYRYHRVCLHSHVSHQLSGSCALLSAYMAESAGQMSKFCMHIAVKLLRLF